LIRPFWKPLSPRPGCPSNVEIPCGCTDPGRRQSLERLGFHPVREGTHIAMVRENPDGTRTPLTIAQSSNDQEFNPPYHSDPIGNIQRRVPEDVRHLTYASHVRCEWVSQTDRHLLRMREDRRASEMRVELVPVGRGALLPDHRADCSWRLPRQGLAISGMVGKRAGRHAQKSFGIRAI
jgi:hypothetical protein